MHAEIAWTRGLSAPYGIRDHASAYEIYSARSEAAAQTLHFSSHLQVRNLPVWNRGQNGVQARDVRLRHPQRKLVIRQYVVEELVHIVLRRAQDDSGNGEKAENSSCSEKSPNGRALTKEWCTMSCAGSQCA